MGVPHPPVHMPCYSHRPSRCSRAVRGSQGWVLRILRPSGTDGRERIGVGRVETAWREALGLGPGGAWAAPGARTFRNGSHRRDQREEGAGPVGLKPGTLSSRLGQEKKVKRMEARFHGPRSQLGGPPARAVLAHCVLLV